MITSEVVIEVIEEVETCDSPTTPTPPIPLIRDKYKNVFSYMANWAEDLRFQQTKSNSFLDTHLQITPVPISTPNSYILGLSIKRQLPSGTHAMPLMSRSASGVPQGNCIGYIKTQQSARYAIFDTDFNSIPLWPEGDPVYADKSLDTRIHLSHMHHSAVHHLVTTHGSVNLLLALHPYRPLSYDPKTLTCHYADACIDDTKQKRKKTGKFQPNCEIYVDTARDVLILKTAKQLNSPTILVADRDSFLPVIATEFTDEVTAAIEAHCDSNNILCNAMTGTTNQDGQEADSNEDVPDIQSSSSSEEVTSEQDASTPAPEPIEEETDQEWYIRERKEQLFGLRGEKRQTAELQLELQSLMRKPSVYFGNIDRRVQHAMGGALQSLGCQRLHQLTQKDIQGASLLYFPTVFNNRGRSSYLDKADHRLALSVLDLKDSRTGKVVLVGTSLDAERVSLYMELKAMEQGGVIGPSHDLWTRYYATFSGIHWKDYYRFNISSDLNESLTSLYKAITNVSTGRYASTLRYVPLDILNNSSSSTTTTVVPSNSPETVNRHH